MILFASGRTDIPAFYAEWFARRMQAGFVLVRNPYEPNKITRYELSPKKVDLIVFCTKNPAPILPHLELFQKFGIYFFVTITPYEKEIELNVPPMQNAIDSFKTLSAKIGKEKVAWRYDPIFLTEKYSAEFHKQSFAKIAANLNGFTNRCVIT